MINKLKGREGLRVYPACMGSHVLLKLTYSFVGFVDKDLIRDLLKECAKMYRFDHPNVLKLSGVCLDGGPAPYIIMPFMANGSLLSYLKNERQSLFLDSKSNKQGDVVSCVCMNIYNIRM